MTVSYAGALTLGQAIPMALSAQGALSATASAALPDVSARIAGLQALALLPPPSLPDLISGVTATLAALNQMLSLPLPDAGAVLAALTDLMAQLNALNAGLAFSAAFGALLGTAGIHYYVYAGVAGLLAADMSGQLSAGLPGGSGPSEQIAGVVMLANDSGAISALQAVMRS